MLAAEDDNFKNLNLLMNSLKKSGLKSFLRFQVNEQTYFLHHDVNDVKDEISCKSVLISILIIPRG